MACRKPGADRKLVAGAPSAAAEYRGLSCHPFNDLLFCFQRGSAQLWTVLRENLYASPARVNWDPWREPRRSLISIVVLLAGSGPFGESVGPVAISRGSWQKRARRGTIELSVLAFYTRMSFEYWVVLVV